MRNTRKQRTKEHTWYLQAQKGDHCGWNIKTWEQDLNNNCKALPTEIKSDFFFQWEILEVLRQEDDMIHSWYYVGNDLQGANTRMTLRQTKSSM